MGKIAAWLYDLEMRLAAKQLNPRRQALLGAVSGRILEIGVGTGQNLGFYHGGASVVAIDPDSGMMARALPRARATSIPVRLLAARGEALPFRDGVFDSVVVTLALCSVDSQDQVLGEMRRVIEPGGKLYFMEHVRSEATGWGRFQDVVTPVWKTVATG